VSHFACRLPGSSFSCGRAGGPSIGLQYPLSISSMALESLPPAATAEHLTEALCRSGALRAGRVSGVTIVSSFPKLRSHTFLLRLDYEGAVGSAPPSLILKMGHLDNAGRPSYANRREIEFYRDVAPHLPERLVPYCFEAVESTSSSRWHLLLEDLTDSHFIATEWPLPPTLEQCESIIQALPAFMPHGGTMRC
jgi:hypothetical protein